MPHLGTGCEQKGCKELNDYLPFKCPFCSKNYCKNHSKPTNINQETGHLCPRMPADAGTVVCPVCSQILPAKGRDPNEIVNQHINEGCTKKEKIYENACHFKNCQKRELVPITCHECQLTFCIKHRLEADHQCKGKPKGKHRKSTSSQKKNDCIIS